MLLKTKDLLMLILFLNCVRDILSAVGRFNAALSKSTTQSSTVPWGGQSEKAVDGNRWSNFVREPQTCTHTMNGQHTWWSVDLGQVYNIYEIIIINRGDCCSELLRDLTIFGGSSKYNSDSDLDLVICASVTNSLPGGESKFSCQSQPMQKRYVTVSKNVFPAGPLTMCEIEVIAECPDGRYGENCANQCPDKCVSCNKDTGYCPNCRSGYTGDQCNDFCRDGTYGDRCKYTCSPNCKQTPCNKFSDTGDCTTGKCKPGYVYGGNCTIVCPTGRYGDNCGSSCSNNCKLGPTCNNVDGSCPSSQCQAGYDGRKCDQVCHDGTYGDRCKFTCSSNCLKTPCNKFSDTGDCTDGKCKPGYVYGGSCRTVCLDGTYGDNCKFNCSENCFDPACDKFSNEGVCADGKCKPGYIYGGNCRTVCSSGTYGENCVNTCSGYCKNKTSCEIDDGRCIAGCAPGFKGPQCNTGCPMNTYGTNCTQCPGHCKKQAPCALDTGKCPAGCMPGYRGLQCTKDCLADTYGENCVNDCPKHCKDTCDKKSGICNCENGYEGDLCTQVIEQQAQQNTDGEMPLAALAGGAVGGIVVIILVVVLVIVLYKRRQNSSKKSETEKSDTNSLNHNGTVQYQNTAMTSIVDEIPETAAKPNIVKHVVVKQRKEPIPPKPQFAVKPNNKALKPVNVKENGIKPSKDKTPLVAAGPKVALKPIVMSKPGKKEKLEMANENTDVYMNVQQSATLMDVKHIGQYISEKKKADIPYKAEYESLSNMVYPCDEALVPDLKIKNRYKNIYPYDNNRVPLKKVGDDNLSTYMNASFVKDYDGNVSYIAALGATVHTLNDYWRMIWEHNVTLIVMVTNLIEDGKIKCDQYWPSTGMNHFDGITVLLEEEIIYPSYTIRTLKANKDKESRRIVHYQYTAWPDKSVPQDLQSLYKIREVVKAYRTQKHVPILIHCSAGVGRTGTLIAMDMLLDQAAHQQKIDIYNCVESLRNQRAHMVQTLIQYVFIHDAVNEILAVGSTVIPLSILSALLNTASKNNKFSKEFEFLESIQLRFEDEEIQLGKHDNKDKNRDITVIPKDNKRVKLLSSPETYINAVYVQGYKKTAPFIATQVPLPNTVADFWKMIYQLGSRTIVCLEEDPKYTNWYCQKKSTETFEQHIVTTSNIEFGDTFTKYDITVGKFSETEYANVGAAGQDSMQIELYNILDWSTKSMKDPLVLSTIIEKLKSSKDKSNGLCTIICRNGATQCGLYIATSWLLDMAEAEEEVDVFNVVKQIRTTRPQFIPTKEQYEFLHRVVLQDQVFGEKEDYVNVNR